MGKIGSLSSALLLLAAGILLPPVGPMAATAQEGPPPAAIVGQPAASSAGAAIDQLRAEAAQDPTNGKAHSRLGWVLLDQGAVAEALRAFEEALRLMPGSAEAKTGKGASLARLGDFPAAEKLLLEALVLNPDPVRAHYELGLLYEKNGAPDRAVAEFKAAIEKFRQGRR